MGSISAESARKGKIRRFDPNLTLCEVSTSGKRHGLRKSSVPRRFAIQML
jgi:hypothetical protein